MQIPEQLRPICLMEKKIEWEHAKALGGVSKKRFDGDDGVVGALEMALCRLVEPTEAELIIVHGRSELGKIYSDWINGQLPNELIVVEVSKGGRRCLEMEEHDPWLSPDGRRGWLLRVRNHSVLDTGELTPFVRLLQMTPFQAEAICNGRLDVIDQALRQVFTRCSVPTLLPAFSILCQGFLAVQCEPDGAGGSIIDVPSEVKGRVLKALEKMGWFEAFASEDVRCILSSGLNELTDDAADWRVKMREYVLTAKFWNVFGQTKTKELEKTVEGEWGGSDFAKSETIKLIASLPLKDGARAGKGFVTLVAEAYMELVMKLEGSQ